MKSAGHVAKSIAEGRRPFLTCTVAGDTFRALDRLALAGHTSRGRTIDRLVQAAIASLDESAGPRAVDCPPDE